MGKISLLAVLTLNMDHLGLASCFQFCSVRSSTFRPARSAQLFLSQDHLVDANRPNGGAPTRNTTESKFEEFKDAMRAGMEFGARIRCRFTAPIIDDPGLPYADSLVIVCGTLLTSALGLKGIIPRPSWLTPFTDLSALGLNLRGLPYILPAWSHASALVGCWLPGALAAAAFERAAYTGNLSEAILRTWKAGAFATGLLILSTQVVLARSLQEAGIDQYSPSPELDIALNRVVGELLSDVFVQFSGLTAFRIYRWADAQGSKADRL